jgi:AmmeMemoRadiSam system protein B
MSADALPEMPKLRNVEAFPIEHEGERGVVLRDPFGFAERVVVLPPAIFVLATYMDGTRGFPEIQAEWARRTGELLFREDLEPIVRALDEAHFLESDRFLAHRRRTTAAFREAPIRPAAHAGAAYPADADAARAFVDGFRDHFDRSKTIEPSPAPEPAARLRGLVAPHIDPRRGAAAYAHAYDALERAGGADLYVIFGTAHQGALREPGAAPRDPAEDVFIATRKSFATPLGVAETDAAFVDRLEKRLGRRLDEAELSHRTEHSVEFQVLFLQRAEERLARGRPARIVPIVCGSLARWTESGASPGATPAVADVLAALRATIDEEEAAGRRVLAIAGADLAHIGLKFGDDTPADEARCRACEAADRASLEPVARGDGEAWFAAIAAEKDRRNICGLSCMYAMLRTLDGAARAGRLLAYGQAPDPAAGSMVSFCAVGLYG